MNRAWIGCFALLFLAITARAAPPAAAPPAPTGLRLDLLAAPEQTVITNPHPRLSWAMNAADPNEVQTAYALQFADSPTGFGASGRAPLYDSGKIFGDRCSAAPYAGPPLTPNADYWWRVRTFDLHGTASAWSAPQHFRTGELVADRQIAEGVERMPLTRDSITPITIGTLANGNRLLDFGRDAYAGLRLAFAAPPAGVTEAVVHLGEKLAADGSIDRKPPGSVRYLEVRLPLAPVARVYNVPLPARDARRMPAMIGPVMPFRYVEIEKGAPDFTAAPVQLTAHYPFDDFAARFTSSDTRLNDVWDLCAYSIKATSFCGIFVDGDRERLPYEADAYINQLGWYACSNDYTLPRYTAEHLLTNTTWPTEWFLHSVLLAWADYLYTGDDDSLRRCYTELKPKALAELEGADGLISTVTPPASPAVLAGIHAKRIEDIVDWPMAERDGYEMRPINTVVNCFHYRALTEMARIADVTGHAADAADYRARAARVAAAINSRLFDPATGLYIDGAGPLKGATGDTSTHSALHANLFPLAFGIVPPDRVQKVAAFVRSRGMACSVYAAQYLMEALYAAGEGEYALDLMLAPGDRSWDHMAHGVGTTLTLEAWDQHYKPNQDWNHAWGAAPANVIPRLLMGVEPIEPAFRTVRIRPQPGKLTHAALTLPTVRGPIHVEFTHPAGGPFTLKTTLPANSRAEIWLPRGLRADTRVTVDGKARAARLDGDFVVIAPVGYGTHVLVR